MQWAVDRAPTPRLVGGGGGRHAFRRPWASGADVGGQILDDSHALLHPHCCCNLPAMGMQFMDGLHIRNRLPIPIAA